MAAWEYAVDNIRINAVGPGFIRTPLVDDHLDQATLEMLAGQHALQRLGQPEEVAELVELLLRALTPPAYPGAGVRKGLGPAPT